MAPAYKLTTGQLESILDHLPALVFLKDLNNRFVFVNKYVADAYGKPKKDLEGVSMYDLYPQTEADAYFKDDLAVISSGMPKLNIEEKWDTPGGTHWVQTSKIPFVDDQGEITGIIGISMDITAKKQADELIQDLLEKLSMEKDIAIKTSFTDGLTQIPNRRYFDVNLGKQISLLKRYEKALSILMIDIDFFKKYNDYYGHVSGDSCLQKVAACIQKSLYRPTDFAARFGGEEFMVILPDSDSEAAHRVGSRIRKELETLHVPHEQSEVAPYVTVSIGGLSFYPHKLDSITEIVNLVDKELYRAKKNGRNQMIHTSLLINEDIGIHPQFVDLVWEDSFQSGNEDIDRQHKELVVIANQLISCLNRNNSEADIPVLFNTLFNSVKDHFEYENRFLTSVAYPHAAEHNELHSSLLEKATDLMQKYRSNSRSVNKIVYFLIIEVVADHLMHEDKKFFSYITTQPDR